MAMEISLDLINQLKVSLPREANLPSFDPVGDFSASSFPGLPTAAEAIAELDASAPDFRCQNCKGKLLRGIDSLICVFCGKQQRTSDNPPDPIKFTSTSGYKWFLSSLNLDGTDSVSLAEQGNFGFFEGKDAEHSFKEDKNLNLFEGKDTQKTISSENDGSFAFFESKDAQRNSSSKEDENFGLVEGKEAQRNSSSKEDENFGLFESKETQRNSSSKEDANLGLFEGVTSSNAGLQSFDDKVVASSSDWDSDFQSADHKPSQDKISGDPFVSSPVDLSAHMDSVFGSGKDLLFEKPADSSKTYVSKAGDWFQDDLLGNATGKTQNNDSAVHDKNAEEEALGGSGIPSMDIDWIGDDLWQTSVKKPAENTAIDANDVDDDWNDFASSANSKTHNNMLSQTMESSQDKIFDGLAHLNNDDKEQSEDKRQNPDTSVMPDIVNGQEDDIFGAWDSFASSTVLQTPLQTPTNHVDPPREQNLEMTLFGTTSNHQVLDSDLPSGSSTLERPSDPTCKKDQTLDLVGTTSTSTKSKSGIAEDLMSQMHDLSFMLETELSVPPVSKTEVMFLSTLLKLRSCLLRRIEMLPRQCTSNTAGNQN